jgi:hypothetical protein
MRHLLYPAAFYSADDQKAVLSLLSWTSNDTVRCVQCKFHQVVCKPFKFAGAYSLQDECFTQKD